MVVIFEPRISGKKADNFIRGCGFERSHKIEAVGFLEAFGFYGRILSQ